MSAQKGGIEARMGKFDGILICSDFDGTMAYEAKVSKENCAAIRNFQSEGGIFCPCSGRETAFFHRYADFFHPNGPVITLNGSVISEYGDCPEDDRVLYCGATPRELTFAFVRDLIGCEGVRRIWLYQLGRVYVVCPKGSERAEDFAHLVIDPDEMEEKIEGDLQKIVVSHDVVHLEAIRGFAEPKYGDRLIFGSSWSEGYEAQLIGTDKGASALRVKKIVGAHTLVSVGDYENDISMLKAADIGYAVENALPNVKEAADRLTVSCTEHAIAKIISDLEAEFA